MKNNKLLTVFLPATFVNILWGLPFALIKMGYVAFGIFSDTGSKLLFAGVRFTIAGFLIILFGSISKKRFLHPTKVNYKRILLLSFTQTVLLYSCFYIGLSNSTGAVSSIINSCNVFFAVLFAAMFFKDDKLTKNKAIGCLIGFVGVMLCTFNGGTFSFQLNGEFLMLLGSIFTAISGVISKKATEKADPYTVAGYNLGFGGLVLCLIGYSLKGKLVLANSSAIPLLLVLSLLSAIAFSIWTKLLKVNKVGEVSVFQFVNPVAGVFFSGIILGEDILQLRYLFAVILITLGILVVFSKMKDSGGQYDKRRSSSTI